MLLLLEIEAYGYQGGLTSDVWAGWRGAVARPGETRTFTSKRRVDRSGDSDRKGDIEALVGMGRGVRGTCGE